MTTERICKLCGTKIKVYNTLQNKCRDCTLKTTKPIPKRGKRTKLYEVWRDTMAIPYLDKRYGHVCSQRGCTMTTDLDVDHKQNRGSHPHLKFDVKNVQWMCRYHHRLKTDGKEGS